MSAIERAKAHYTDLGVQSQEVPEWGEPADGENPVKPLIIYWKPITLSEKQQLQTIGERDGYVARLADALIMKALDAEGKKLFTIEHKHALRHQVDPDVLARVVMRMMASPGVTEMGKP
jgi:hypothetical protein